MTHDHELLPLTLELLLDESERQLLALVLVFALSLRLRQGEIQTIFKLGCSRSTIVRLLGAEIAIILGISALLTALLLVVVARVDEPLVRVLFIR